ncbi:hypothetical protein D3C80_1800040 [compost metagenome]
MSSVSWRAFGRLRLIQNSEPSPELLSTPISPPMCSIRRLEITSPSPVPPACRDSELSAWVKAWNSPRTSLLLRPMPVSLTLMRSCACSSSSSSTMARTEMLPSWVNLMALLTRLVSTCFRRCGSPIRCSGVSR